MSVKSGLRMYTNAPSFLSITLPLQAPCRMLALLLEYSYMYVLVQTICFPALITRITELSSLTNVTLALVH